MARHYTPSDIQTIGQARMAGYRVSIHCTRCSASTTRHPYTLMCARQSLSDARLGEPLTGFFCRTCRKKVRAIVRCTFKRPGEF